MPNVLDANGLQVRTRDEIDAYLTGKYQEIYGADINLDPETPDGQFKGILIQEIVDLQDLLVAIYNSFDPDNAIGVTLYQRVAINGIQVQGGTFTITPITLVNDRSVTLWGLDEVDEADPLLYIIQDNAGNRWFLQETQAGLSAGSHSLSFRSELPGAQLTMPNTITVPVTIVLGVVSVNNPTTPSEIGVNQESDAALKIRRQKSVAGGSQGYHAALYTALSNLSGMTSAYIYENESDVTDSDGTPSHSIWVIISGSAAAEDIAMAIFQKRNAGCGMRGDQTYTVQQPGGGPIVIRWDNVITQNVFIILSLSSIDSSVPPNVQAIREGLPSLLTPGVAEPLNITAIGTLVQSIDPNAVLLLAGGTGISDGTDQRFNLIGTPDSGQFRLNYNGEQTGLIDYDATSSDIETELQALTGLENVDVSGDPVSGTMIFDLSDCLPILALITVSDNSLQDGLTPVIFSSDIQAASVLSPLTKQHQFVPSTANIIITPILLLPAESEVEAEGTEQFNAYGGYGDYLFSVNPNPSGGTIDPSTGEYEAGSTPAVTDTVHVIDGLGNEQDAEVDVT